MESTDLGTHTKTTIPPGPPSAQIGEDARRRRRATNKELLNLWRRKRQEVSWRREEGKKERGSFQGKIKGWGEGKQSKPGPVPLTCQWAAQRLVITLFEMTMA